MNRLFFVTCLSFAASCAGAPHDASAPNLSSAPSSTANAPQSLSVASPVADASNDSGPDADDANVVDAALTGADAAAVASSATSEPQACPEDMVLVDGDYCTDLDMKCLKSTYAPQNRKTICWIFEEPTVCNGSKVHKRYCMDRYEYPNKKGERPKVMVNFPQAQHICAAQGKRMCTETEWTMACEGPTYKPYPYGYKRDPKICNGDQPYRFPKISKAFSHDKAVSEAELERLWEGVPSGSQPQCVSDYGVYDMPGNADELASSETFSAKSQYDNVTTGGPWLEGVRNQCRPKIYTHNEGFAYYYLSFRCCAEPDGKPTDPRSPKQIKRNERWK